MKKFWNMKVNASDSSVGELYLYGDISSTSWWGDEITPQTFKEDLDNLGPIKNLNVYVNSNGGDVFAGQTIHSMIKRHDAYVTVYVDGLAASIASVICMAGDKVVMPRNSMMLVHNPWTFAVGNANDMRKMAEDLDAIAESLISAYEEKTGLGRGEIKSIMDAETWMTADECKEKGFCDEVLSEKKVAAALRGNVLAMNGQEFDLSRFHNRPNVEVVAELPTQTPIVEGELPEALVKVVGDKYIVVVDGKDVAQFMLNESTKDILAAGKSISKKNMDKLQKSCDMMMEMKGDMDSMMSDMQSKMDAMKTKMDDCMQMVEDVMDDGKEDDNDTDDSANNKKKDEKMDPDHDPMHEPDEDPDDKKDAVLETVMAELRKMNERMDAMQASFSNAVPTMRSVEPSPAKGEDDIVSLEEEHVIDIVDEPAENEVNIEAESLTQSIKAAIDEKMAEFRLHNMGKVD